MALTQAVRERAQVLKTSAFWSSVCQQVIKKGILLIPLAVVGIVAYQAPTSSLTFWESHPGVALLILFPILLWPIWKREATQRHITAMGGDTGRRSAKQKTRPLKPLMQPYWRSFSQWVDIVFFNDTPKWRLTYLGSFLVVAVTLLVTPIAATAVLTEPRQPAELLPNLVIQVAAPVVFYLIVATRCHSIGKLRMDIVKTLYNVAALAFKYPQPGTAMRRAGDDAALMTPECIQVTAWETLTIPRQFSVPTTKSTSATDEHAWAELGANLNQRVEATTEDGWHVTRDKRGTGCVVTPANYPRGVLWDGEQDPDPMAFLIGHGLDNGGEWIKVAFGVTSPHFIGTGPTGTGKTSFAEAILAQAATKQMPWDPNLNWECHIIDPKDSLKNRWEGRPNITATSGVHDSFNDDGDVISGIEALAEHMRRLGKELDRRMIWLSQYKNAANWKDVPDEEKKKHGFRPILIVTDEFTDHVEPDKDKSEQSERDNDAKAVIVSITKAIFRKGRSVGMHVVLIVQRGNMQILGSQIVTNGQGRYIMGNTDDAQYKSMLGTTDVPVLPAETWDEDKAEFVPIPGRARLQNTGGGRITRLQVLWFGGKSNSETLDKWLPRSLDGAGNGDDKTADDDAPSSLSWVASDDSADAVPGETQQEPEHALAQEDTPPWETDEAPASSQSQGEIKSPLQQQRDAAQTAVKTEPAPTNQQRREPTPQPRTSRAQTGSKEQYDALVRKLDEVTEAIKALNRISPHTITDAQRDQQASLFEERRKLMQRMKKSKRTPSPTAVAPQPTPSQSQPASAAPYQDHDVREMFG